MQTSEHITNTSLSTEIFQSFGFIPPFFDPAEETPEVLENLQRQTITAYVHNPLPNLFKEKLFAYLSRNCSVPYCIICHSCVLRSLGMTAQEILALLEIPTPTKFTIEEKLVTLMQEPGPLTDWPEAGSELENALLHCSFFLFLKPKLAPRCRVELRRLLGPIYYNHLVGFLAYIKTCHLWVETHPELSYEADKRAQDYLDVLLTEEPGLVDFFAMYNERVRRERQEHDERLIAEIAERKQAEEAQRRIFEEKLYQAAQEAAARASQLEATFEAMSDIVLVYDREGHLLHANAAAREFHALDIQPDYYSLPARQRLAQYAVRDEQGQPLAFEQWPVSRILKGEALTNENAVDVIMFARDGREVQLSVTGNPVHDTEGHIAGAVMVCRDVTERRRLERRAHETLEALLAMAESLVHLPDSDDSMDEEISDISGTQVVASVIAQRLAELTCSVLGCRRVSISAVEPETEVLYPIAVVGLSAEQEQQWWAEQRQQESSLKNSPRPELVSTLRSNEVLIFDMTQPPFNEQPNPYGIKVVLVAPMQVGSQLVGLLSLDYGGAEHTYTVDEIALAKAVARLAALVIERGRLLHERAEAHASELALREANRRMDEFLGIASHELKTPLTSIKGYVQLMARRLKKSNQKKMAKAVNSVNTANNGEQTQLLDGLQDLLERTDSQVGRLNRLVNELLDVSRIQANKLDLLLEPCNLVEIVQEIVQDARQASPTRTIFLKLPSNQEVPLLADADRIRQVVSNYLTNALKYSEEDRPVEISLQVEEHVARVSVRDEGPGLSPAEQVHIWERFYQVEGVEVQSGSGMGLGLGLYICRKIIEVHSGQVGVQSSPGQGSIFWFTLPMM